VAAVETLLKSYWACMVMLASTGEKVLEYSKVAVTEAIAEWEISS